MNTQDESVLKIRDVTKVYKGKGALFGASGKDVTALDRVSFDIFKGEIFGLVGESGSGKTTVGRLIVGLEDVSSGKIFLNGREVVGLKGRARKEFRSQVQMIFQDPYQSLNPQRAIYDTVSEPLKIHGVGNASTKRDLVREILQSVGLSPPDDFLFKYPHRLSGGQRQRVAIARAMVLKPTFVIADEPTSMLDASISAQIFNILLDMRNRLDVTQMFITHSLAAARYLCDRVAVIYRGNLMEIGSAEEVIRNPKHPYTQALLDAVPKFGHHRDVSRYGTLLIKDRDVAGENGCVFFPRCAVALEDRCAGSRPLLGRVSGEHRVACFLVEGA
ncbi:MAG: ABC transporter ATP-binding protein [Deltaproteobacteria bacterium]|nr:ABC transporter ATP-binding protein [Deltaproteobacteria bacterium]MBW2047727.1 ABC transporter ATP-binding protein [Deltaproteobacteria bacterium]MBW2110370.1 ABC transporter ATP-binding protein [Deltaproteobacteria bacterium]MBW2352258.1 ABC transporter ATP-binding protein [Deltaproteobacteria bacterium]HDZ90067.1 ABC transporter ATP-binding protein [Deltaproteobacteria bacterium]